MWQRRTSACFALFLGLTFAPSGFAAVVTSVETDIAPPGMDGYTPTFPSGGPSAADVLNGKSPIASAGNFTQESSTGLPALTNGTFNTAYGNGTSASQHAAYATAGDGNFVTYSLGGAYDLSSIVIYGGWPDGGRDAQHYDLLVSSDGGLNFTTLGSIDINPGVQNTDTTPVSNRVAFTEDALPSLAASVTTVRVNFLAVENGYTGYAEIDVFGTPLTIPGDADGNGIINLLDFNLITDHFHSVPSAPGLDGDVNLDNYVDQKDFREWRIAFGQDATGTAFAVPEPASLALGGLACAAALGLIRRRW
ncbi:MAG: PEP-CTERM sorting domain-containing protein [Planctomycetales bacterium]|nr:PEP-CTERM sorting domain-containing protein [Planctomycetales bacterium]